MLVTRLNDERKLPVVPIHVAHRSRISVSGSARPLLEQAGRHVLVARQADAVPATVMGKPYPPGRQPHLVQRPVYHVVIAG